MLSLLGCSLPILTGRNPLGAFLVGGLPLCYGANLGGDLIPTFTGFRFQRCKLPAFGLDLLPSMPFLVGWQHTTPGNTADRGLAIVVGPKLLPCLGILPAGRGPTPAGIVTTEGGERRATNHVNSRPHPPKSNLPHK